MEEDNAVVVKPYRPSDLARLYGVSRWTLRRWLKPHQKDIGKRYALWYTTRQVKVIFEKLGFPGE